MAFNTPKSFASAAVNDSILNTPPTARLFPENKAEDVLTPASFTLETSTPVLEQKKLSAPTPPGLLALRAEVADLDQQLSRCSPTAPGQPSPSSPEPVAHMVIDGDDSAPHTPMIINILDDSPPPAPMARRLRRQNAVIDLTTPRSSKRSSPFTRPVESAPTAIVQELQSLRRRLNYEEEEEDHLETDVTMENAEEETVENTSVRTEHLSVAPVLMAVKSLASIINEVVHKSCIGCTRNYPSQKDHEDCMWLEWSDKVDKYFDRALSQLNEARFFQFINHVYNVQDLFEEEQDLCVGEASAFYHEELPKREVQLHVKSKLKEL